MNTEIKEPLLNKSKTKVAAPDSNVLLITGEQSFSDIYFPPLNKNVVLDRYFKKSQYWCFKYMTSMGFFLMLFLVSFIQGQRKYVVKGCQAQDGTNLALSICVQSNHENNFFTPEMKDLYFEDMDKGKLMGIFSGIMIIFCFLAVSRAYSYTQNMVLLLIYGIKVNLGPCSKFLVFIKTNLFSILLWALYLFIYLYEYIVFVPERTVATEIYGNVRLILTDYSNPLLKSADVLVTFLACVQFFMTVYSFYYDYVTAHIRNFYSVTNQGMKPILKIFYQIDIEIPLSQYDEVYTYFLKKSTNCLLGCLAFCLYCNKNIDTEDIVRMLAHKGYVKLEDVIKKPKET